MIYLLHMTPLYIALAVAAVVVIAFIGFYNRFVTLTNRVKEAWADIDVQLKRRYDLIPNLVETVKGYAAHEASTLEAVTAMRTRAMGATDPSERAEAENMLTDALKSLFAVSENYPNLKANENFVELQRELSDTENKIQAARRFYNSVVMDLNTAVHSFPSNVVAGIFGFRIADFFELGEADAAAKEPVRVSF